MRKRVARVNPAKYPITWFMTLLFLGLAACQSNPTYQAFPGPAKPADQIASVFIPKAFNLLNVDGNSYTQPLMGNGTVVKLLPGSHKIVIKYVDFWEVTADNTERVTSQPILVAFDARAGENYYIPFTELKDVKAARAFVKDPHVDLVNKKTNTSVATDVKYQLEDKGLIAAFMDSLSPKDTPAPTVAEATDQETRAKGEPALEMLKYWWQKANAQQQESFMKWVAGE